jgi:two-component system, chemotaxis family, sensor kinase Cph1
MADFDQSQLLACEREQLANSGLIQPHGALLFIDKASGTFRYVSANAESLLGEAPESLLGRDGRDWLEQHLPEPVELPTNAGKRYHLIGALDLGGGELNILISPNSAGWILEFEPTLADEHDPNAHRLPSLAPPIDAAKLPQLQQCLVEVVSAITDYDRVMLYQFHLDWSGEVLAETVRLSKGTYLGLRFPASDIPAIARGLYAQTPYRHIPDAAAVPVSLVGRASDGTQLDLTWSDLRSVSTVHAEYLHNMNVRSSFSVSIIVDGKLWGLVACHHPTPKTISLQRRQHCRDLTTEFAATLQSIRKGTQRGLYEALTDCLAPIKARVTQGKPLAAAFAHEFPALARLFGASSGGLCVDQVLTPLGEPQEPQALNTLHQWCLRHQGETVLAMDHLPESLHEALGPGTDRFHGVLSVGLRAKRRGNALVNLYLLRPEEATEIAWAGNPEKPSETTADGQRLSPRHSFDRWVEVRHGYSRPWDEDSLFAAQQLRELLMAWL